MSAHFGGVGGLNQNADTADAGGVSDKMMTLGIRAVGKSGFRAEIKRK